MAAVLAWTRRDEEQFRGRGYASEAAEALREHAFRVLGQDYVISIIRPENLPSQGVARRLGMQPMRDILWRGFTHTVWRRANRVPVTP